MDSLLKKLMKINLYNVKHLQSENTYKIYALNLLTHNPNVSYMDYILNLAHNNLAREVKLRDLEHNSKITRLKGLREKDFQRLQKYQIAYDYLKNYK